MNTAHEMEKTATQIGMVEKGLRESEKLRQYAQTKESMYVQQLKEIDEELEKLGVNPENAESEIETLNKRIQESLRAVAKVIPFQLLKDCKYIEDGDIPTELLQEVF